jgi:prepilin-type N-terminal cleavage/methylation domain-containing protein
MKKNTIKAFTLVEMLIVIVIIGILIASLMPRMQSAQWRARDVARKNDLAQIQTAIITSQQDRGAFPGMAGNAWKTWSTATTTVESGSAGMIVDNMAYNLQTAGMTSVPADPNGSNVNYWLGWYKSVESSTEAEWKYIYLVAKRNWVDNAWFALMAKTEVEWWSNRVVCWNGTNVDTWHWYISSWDDLAKLTTCKKVSQTWTAEWCKSNQEECYYYDTAELRYILLY